jgi:hypothetical protein
VNISKKWITSFPFASGKSIDKLLPFDHSLAQVNRSAVNFEGAIALVMKRSLFFSIGVQPDLNRFKNKQVIPVHQSSVECFTFYVRNTLFNER